MSLLGIQVRALAALGSLPKHDQDQLRAFANRIGLPALFRMIHSAAQLARETATAALPEILSNVVNREARRYGIELTREQLDVATRFTLSVLG